MISLRKLCNYFFYCGLERDEYNAVKKDAYVSNFVIWRSLHVFITVIFGLLFAASLFNIPLKVNRVFYLVSFIYSAIASLFFFFLKKDSIIPQFLIYLSISLLFLLGCFITKNNPSDPATTFIALLLITPMFMIDKPFFMTIELFAVSIIFIIWMYFVKPLEVWQVDLINVIIFTIVGAFLNIIANSIRIKEFVLTREINIQKDTDELTCLKNKGALTREINEFLSDVLTDKGIMIMLDIDRFKAINDTYGHDIGDHVISQLGNVLSRLFVHNEITGRFGGDEFIIFIRNTDSLDAARNIAQDIINCASENISLPDPNEKISISLGIAIYKGKEKNYSELFKKADTALYKTKANKNCRYFIYEEGDPK